MKRKAILKWVRGMRDNVRNAVPFELHFSPCGKMTKEERKILEDHLRHRFKNWSESWIHPYLDMVEAEVKREMSEKT